MKLDINAQIHEIDADPDMPLLWAIRDIIGLTGTKFGCGMAQCGACTVHQDGVPIRSCITPISAVEGTRITTIEGLDGGVAGRCSQPGLSLMCRNAAIASQDR